MNIFVNSISVSVHIDRFKRTWIGSHKYFIRSYFNSKVIVYIQRHMHHLMPYLDHCIVIEKFNKCFFVVLPCSQAKIREKVEYDDLEGEEAISSAPALKLARLGPYLHGPTPVIAMQYSTSEDMIHACQAFTQEMMAWQSQQTQVCLTLSFSRTASIESGS